MFCQNCEKAFCIYCRQVMEKGHYQKSLESACKTKRATISAKARVASPASTVLRVLGKMLTFLILMIVIVPLTATIFVPYAIAVSAYECLRRTKRKHAEIYPETATATTNDPKVTTLYLGDQPSIFHLPEPGSGDREGKSCVRAIAGGIVFVAMLGLAPLTAIYCILLVLYKSLFGF